MTEYWTGGSGDDYKDYTGSDNFWADGGGAMILFGEVLAMTPSWDGTVTTL